MNDTVELLLLVGTVVGLTLWLSGRSNHGRGGHNRTTLASGAYGAPSGGAGYRSSGRGPTPGGPAFWANANSGAGVRNPQARTDS